MNEYLDGTLLVAPPKMVDWRFRKSVVYIWKHDVGGAAGVIINKPMLAPTFENICLEGKIIKDKNISPLIHYGGPIFTNMIGCLHTDDYKLKTTNIPNSRPVGFTMDRTAIIDIAKKNGPKRYVLTMGMASWFAGQLESEMDPVPPHPTSLSWLVLNFDKDLCFSGTLKNTWEKCVELAIQQKSKSIVDNVFKKGKC